MSRQLQALNAPFATPNLPALAKPCAQCPWRLSNHGKRTRGSFYSKANIKRLWNQLRGATREELRPQSCHLTDDSHPDHVAAGAKVGATVHECPGSVIVIVRELRILEKLGGGTISPEAVKRYQAARRRGLTTHGLMYWVVQRVQFAGAAVVGGPPLPPVDESDAEIGLPAEFAE